MRYTVHSSVDVQGLDSPEEAVDSARMFLSSDQAVFEVVAENGDRHEVIPRKPVHDVQMMLAHVTTCDYSVSNEAIGIDPQNADASTLEKDGGALSE